ncbi:MAG: beta-lactamase family protein [bacterium]|nr:beta-lactamase family protein [bacterium]
MKKTIDGVKTMTKTIILIIIILMFGTSFVSGGQTQSVLDDYISEYFKRSAVPGLAVVVVKDGRVLYLKAKGVQRAGEPGPMTVHTLNGLGSGTKSMTALAAMQLVESGKLDLDAPITTYLPSFRTADQEQSKKITMRMLLSNTSGLPGFDATYFKEYASVTQGLKETVAALASERIDREPGQSFQYSNRGYALAGLVISRLSGLSYEEYMKKNVFHPMAMKTTTTDPKKLKKIKSNFGNVPGIARAYPLDSPIIKGSGIEPAGILLRTSAAELGNYLITLLAEGEYRGVKIISSQSLAQLWEPQVTMPAKRSRELGGQAENARYCLGWFKETIDGRTVYHHGGMTGAFSTQMFIDPLRKTAVAIMANTGELNPYKYPALETAANNLLHIVSNEPLSNYAVPIQGDPTINDYTLSLKQKKKYVGTYVIASEMSGGATYQYSITLDRNGRLKGESFSNQSIGRFLIDSRSASVARARHIGLEFTIDFKITLKGVVSGLTIYGAYYNKIKTHRPGFKERQWPGRGLTFLFSNQWRIDWGNDCFTAVGGGGRELGSGFIPSSPDHLATLIGTEYPGEAARGIVTYPSRLIAGKYYTQVFGTVPGSGKEKKQKMVAYAYMGEEIFYIVLTVPEGELTRWARDIVRPFLISIKHKSGRNAATSMQ